MAKAVLSFQTAQGAFDPVTLTLCQEGPHDHGEQAGSPSERWL